MSDVVISHTHTPTRTNTQVRCTKTWTNVSSFFLFRWVVEGWHNRWQQKGEAVRVSLQLFLYWIHKYTHTGTDTFLSLWHRTHTHTFWQDYYDSYPVEQVFVLLIIFSQKVLIRCSKNSLQNVTLDTCYTSSQLTVFSHFKYYLLYKQPQTQKYFHILQTGSYIVLAVERSLIYSHLSSCKQHLKLALSSSLTSR